MSEKRKKRSSEIVNELSTSCKAQFKTPERNNSRVLEKDGIDGKEFEGGFSVNFMSPGQNNLGDRFIPKRGSAISRQLFNMPENVLASPSDISNKNEKEQNSLIFENLLEQKLLKLKYEHMNESLKDQSDQIKSSGFFANNSGSKSSKSQTTPVKKMNDQHFIIKRPKLLNFSDTKDERLFKEDTPTDTIIDSKVIRSIRNMRKISKTPFKVLDAPGLLDDFYQNILDWSASDVISIALSGILYFWSNRQKDNNVIKVSELMDESIYCSLKWNPTGTMIGTGSNVGVLEITDANKYMPLWTHQSHNNRISSMSWMSPTVVSTGSRDNTIKTFDLRSNQPAAVLRRHKEEVCGLKWSPNGIHLASGGNDNIINIWDHRK